MPSIKLLSRRAEKTTAVPVSDRNIIQIITAALSSMPTVIILKRCAGKASK
jgi:hypothetical protein